MQPASRCRSAGTDDELAGRSYRDRYPAVVGLLDFSDRPAAVDHHPVDDAHPVVARPVSIPLFSVCSFESPTNVSPRKTHSKVVKFPRCLKAKECKLRALRTDNIHYLAVL